MKIKCKCGYLFEYLFDLENSKLIGRITPKDVDGLKYEFVCEKCGKFFTVVNWFGGEVEYYGSLGECVIKEELNTN